MHEATALFVLPRSLSRPTAMRPGVGACAVLVTLLAAFAIAPAAAPAGVIRHDRDPQAYLNLAADPAYASVGRIEETVGRRPGYTGSGTLVAPQWVLTAAHVIEEADTASFVLGDRTYTATSWVQHPKYTGDLVKGFDLALVRLAEPVEGVAPARLYGGKREMGAVGAFLGFGRTGDGRVGDTSYDELKRGGMNSIDGIVKNGKKGLPLFVNKLPKTARTFAVDFDNPTNAADSALGDSAPLDLEYLIARGDSGGPVFIDRGEGPVLAGIHSFAEIPDGRDDSDYGDVTGHTRVSTFAKWIERTLKENDASVAIQNEANLRRNGLPRMLEPTGAALLAGGDAALVPEPSTFALLLPALALLARRRRRPTRA